MTATGFLILATMMMLIGVFSEYLYFLEFDPGEQYEPLFMSIFFMLQAIYFRISEKQMEGNKHGG